jgi:hypothetical protein
MPARSRGGRRDRRWPIPGYAHRAASGWTLPLRAAGASLVQDLHPVDRGPKGTYAAAIVANGNLYCPAAPRALLELGPLPRDAGAEQAADHDRRTAEAARDKLGRTTGDDPDGYHRVMCTPRPRRNTTARRRPTGAPTPGAPPRAVLRHRQGPRQQRPPPRLVPAHGTDRAHPVHRLPARRAQPAGAHRLRAPTNARRAVARIPPSPSQDPRQPHRTGRDGRTSPGTTTPTSAPNPRPQRFRIAAHSQPGVPHLTPGEIDIHPNPTGPLTPAAHASSPKLSDPNVKRMPAKREDLWGAPEGIRRPNLLGYP